MIEATPRIGQLSRRFYIHRLLLSLSGRVAYRGKRTSIRTSSSLLTVMGDSAPLVSKTTYQERTTVSLFFTLAYVRSKLQNSSTQLSASLLLIELSTLHLSQVPIGIVTLTHAQMVAQILAKSLSSRSEVNRVG
jgi:hypothetical protein